VAGTGSDPAPYFRVFNPVKQGQDHDPAGDYIRRWVPELRDVQGKAVHEPWTLPGRPARGLPAAGGRPRRRARRVAAPLRRGHGVGRGRAPSRLAHRRAVRARDRRPRRAALGRSRLPRLPAARGRHAGGLRARDDGGAARAGGRAARRRRGRQGPAVRRPRRPAAGAGARRGGCRPQHGLRHQRRQALQVHPSRHAPHPRHPRHLGGRGLPAVASRRARAGAARAGGAARRHRREDGLRTLLPGDPAARRRHGVAAAAGAAGARDDPPVGGAAGRRPRRRTGGLVADLRVAATVLG
jgi:hypothetical protein